MREAQDLAFTKPSVSCFLLELELAMCNWETSSSPTRHFTGIRLLLVWSLFAYHCSRSTCCSMPTSCKTGWGPSKRWHTTSQTIVRPS